jgi:DNA polymerase III epsilon subunit-like protein
MVMVLIIDTETTGLFQISGINNKKIEHSIKTKDFEKTLENFNEDWVKKCPHITQISFILYDTEKECNVQTYNKYIDMDVNIKIHKMASKITNMYSSIQYVIDNGENPFDKKNIVLSELKKISPDRFITIEQMMDDFMFVVNQCECIIGHNIVFDIEMLLVELKRINQMFYFKNLFDIKHECTMMESIEICNLMVGKRKKYPKLQEAYNILFNYEPFCGTLHDALVDAYICLKIYCKLKNLTQPVFV